MTNSQKKIGITTTIPSELVFAAGMVPVDLNNVFIASKERLSAITAAETDGYPRTVCGWIKGIYGMVTRFNAVQAMVAVTEGDCSQTHALFETLEDRGIEVIPFSYPFDRDQTALRREMQKLALHLGTTLALAEEIHRDLREVRSLVWEIDRLTWEEGKVSGLENHLWQVSCSDFEGVPPAFAAKAGEFIYKANQRKPLLRGIRLGFIGVPPILDNIYDCIEQCGASVVFNEVQRQFSLPGNTGTLLGDYLEYTYPYHVRRRTMDINRQIEIRNIDALIHYTQSFCFRQIEDIYFRRKISVPILTIEAETPGLVDARTEMRLETFISMLRR